MNANICNYISRNDKTKLLCLLIHQNIIANSVYTSLNLTSAQMEFRKLLDENEVDIFRFEEIEGKLDRSYGNLNEILEKLIEKTIVNCFYINQYSGGFSELIRDFATVKLPGFNDDRLLKVSIKHCGIIQQKKKSL